MTQHSAGASALPPYSQMAGLGAKDSLDDFVIEVGSAKPSASFAMQLSASATALPRSLQPPRMVYEGHMRKPETVNRLLNNAIFPTACFVGRRGFNHTTVSQRNSALPWRVRAFREERGVLTPIDRQFYHQPNEFGEDVAAAARMVLKLFGGR